MRFQNQDGWLETRENKLYVVSKYKLVIKPALETEYGYCFGFVQGISASFGPFSPSELNELKSRVWKLKNANLQYSGVRDLPNDWKQPIKKGA